MATLGIKDLGAWTTRWCVEARVIDVAPVNTFSRKDGTSGKIFSCDLMDKEGDSIRAKFWDGAADLWSPKLLKGKVFRFSNGRLAIAQGRRYSTCTSKYEITFGTDATIEQLEDEGAIKAQRKSDPVPILQLRKRDDYPYVVDLCVVVKVASEAEPFTVRTTGEQSVRKSLVVYDDSSMEMEITLFGELAEKTDLSAARDGQPLIVELQSIQIREFRGIRGASVRGSAVIVSPDSEAARKLTKWTQQFSGSHPALESLSENAYGSGGAALGPSPNPPLSTLQDCEKYLQECPVAESSQIDPREVWTVLAEPLRIFYRNRNNDFVLNYPACKTCRKKVSDIGGGSYHCDTCYTSTQKPEIRFMAGVSLIDCSASRFLARAFHEQMMTFLGANAKELLPLGSASDALSVEATQLLEYQALWRPYRLRLRCRRELFSGEERPNVTILSAEPADFGRLARLMLNQLAAVGIEVAQAERKRPREEEAGDVLVEKKARGCDPILSTAET